MFGKTIFWEKFSDYGDSIALIEGNKNLTYKELDTECIAFAKQLVSEKSLILLGISNTIEAIIALYGAIKAGHSVIVYDPSNTELKLNLQKSFKPNYHYYQDLDQWRLEHLTNGVSSADLHPELSLIISTSGSTGSVKCVRLSKNNLNSNASSITQYLNINSSDNAALVLPLHYCYGLSVLNSHLNSGACTHIGRLSVIAHDFKKYLLKNNITSFAGVPYTYEILERINFREETFPALRYITQAGGRLSTELASKYAIWANDNQKKFFIMYGQTEATSRIAFLPSEKTLQYTDCIGIPIPGGEIYLSDEQGQLVTQDDKPGELIYKGPNVMMGYAETWQELAKDKQLDVLATGDLATRNKDGIFKIVGRLKRFSKIYGKRLNLDEAEKFLSTQGISSVCVSNDEKLFVCIERSNDIEESHIKSSINSAYHISEDDIDVYIVSGFPLLSSGKIDYLKLTSQAVSNNKIKNNQETPLQSKVSVKVVKEIFERRLKIKNISTSNSFQSLGGDSLNYVALSIDLNKVLGELPKNWNSLSIDQIASSHLEKKQSLIRVDTSILIRFYAIAIVVINHAGAFFGARGAVILLLVCGVNYARFQIEKQIKEGPTAILQSLLIHVLVPYWLVLCALYFIKGIDIQVSDILLFRNNIPGKTNIEWDLWIYWFIQAYIQALLFFSLPLCINNICLWVLKNKSLYFYIMLVIAIIVRVFDSLLGINATYDLQSMHISWVLWIFCIGACLTTGNNKLFLSGLLIALTLIFYREDSRLYTLIIGGLVFIYYEKIPVPQVLLQPIQIIASASFFIYLLHNFVPHNSYVSIGSLDISFIICGFFLGISSYYLYEFLLSKLTSFKVKFMRLVRRFVL